MLTEMDPVDHQRDEIQVREIRVHHLIERAFGHRHEPARHRRTRRRARRGFDLATDRFETRCVTAGWRAPPSSSPTRAHPTAQTTRTSHRPRPAPPRCGPRSGPAGDAPSPAGPRGLPRRPRSRAGPQPGPGGGGPSGPTSRSRSPSIKTCITCRPAPTASANKPSRTAPVNSPIADVLGGAPDTYQPAGLGRGTATSTSTTTGTTSGPRRASTEKN